MERIRACPICHNCGSKKFERVPSGGPATVRCLSCCAVMEI